MQIEIDNGSGFCFGVTTAIKKAEEELASSNRLYCLGDIVHNGMECERLRQTGLVTIDHEQMRQLHNVKVLLRAHGEPPETYELARQNNIEIIDATCPVVLQLQKRIKKQYEEGEGRKEEGEGRKEEGETPQIVIFGKKGHAEVLGLVGQTQQHAVVIERFEEVERLDYNRDIYLYSQTTKSLDEYHRIIDYIRDHIAPTAHFQSFDTICRSVANRMPQISQFATHHELILFVCGRKSSNGKVLFSECQRVNPNSHLIEDPSEIRAEWLEGIESVGICGATSTPKWLMEQCRDVIMRLQSKKDSLIIVSGGMDSITMLYEYQDRIGMAVTFDYGSNHADREVSCALLHCQRLGIRHLVIPLDFMHQYFHSSLLEGADAIPEGHYAEENMLSTVVPFRNGIMLSIAAGIAESNGLQHVMIANHGGDHTIYPDCREGFIKAMSEATSQGTYAHIDVLAPYTNITKADIARRGAQLGIDYSETWSCYKGGERHCGRCATCVERREAMAAAGIEDPTEYEE